MIELKDACILGAVGALVVASGLHLSAESTSLSELRHQNEEASLWAVQQEREPVTPETVVTVRIVDDEVLGERNEHAKGLRNQLTGAYSTLSERGKTLDFVGEPIAPEPFEWQDRFEYAKSLHRAKVDGRAAADGIIHW